MATGKIFDNLILQLGGIVASSNLLVNTCMFWWSDLKLLYEISFSFIKKMLDSKHSMKKVELGFLVRVDCREHSSSFVTSDL